MGILLDEVRERFKNETIKIANLVELDFDFGVERYWSGVHELEYDGVTWTPTGNLGSISPLESSQELRANGVELSVLLPMQSDMETPQVNFQNITASDYKGKAARIITAFFDDDFQNVIHTLERRYQMDAIAYNIDPRRGAGITIRCESELLAKGKRRVKKWTDTQQRDEYPSDLSMQFLSYLSSNVQVKWGSSGAFFQS